MQDYPLMSYADYDTPAPPPSTDYGPLPTLNMSELKNKESISGTGVRS
jgi:hypothetical protein